jgi:hypothetical protein
MAMDSNRESLPRVAISSRAVGPALARWIDVSLLFWRVVSALARSGALMQPGFAGDITFAFTVALCIELDLTGPMESAHGSAYIHSSSLHVCLRVRTT